MKNDSVVRVVVAALSLSAAGFVGIVTHESYTDKAVIPVPGDVPTVGFGSTRRDDGSQVRMTDTITPVKAVTRAVRDIKASETVLKGCLDGVELAQYELDAFLDLAYNVGPGAVCKSSITGKLREKRYEDACRTILDFKRVQGRDCSLPENKRFCGGVWTRRQQMANLCLTGEYPIS